MMQNDSFICVVCFHSCCNQPSETHQELHFWSLALYPWYFCNSGTSFARQSVISCDISDILTTDYHVELRPKTCKTQFIFSFKVVQSGFQYHFTTELPRRDSEVRCLAVRLGSQRSHFIWFQDVSTTPSKLPSFVHGLVWKWAIPWTLSFYSWHHNGHRPSNWGGAKKKNHTQRHFEICTSMYNKFWVGPTEIVLYNSTMISAASRLRKMSPRCRRVVPRWRPFRKVGGWAQLRVPHGALIFKRPCDLGWHIQINTT